MELDALATPMILGHRGDKVHAPENTLAAFKRAFENGADGVELDTKLSADGAVVVMHDLTLDRTTDGRGPLSKMTLAALRELDAGSHFSAGFQGECVPTLEEVFEEVGKLGVIDIELTNYASPRDALPQRVAELIQRHNLAGSVFVSSFHPLNLVRFRRLMPQVPAGLLTEVGQAGNLARGWMGRWIPHQLLISYFTDVGSGLVKREHTHHRKLFAWLEAQPDDIRQLFSAGIDGVITDDPGLARQLLARQVLAQ